MRRKDEGRKERAAQNEKWGLGSIRPFRPQNSMNERFYLPPNNRKYGTVRSL